MLNDNELDRFINDLWEMHGYDFTDYSKASLQRRMSRLFLIDKINDFPEFSSRLLNNPGYLQHVVEEITVNVTEMFRDPLFYKALRETVIPIIATHPFIRIWHAGCSTGEEVYSMAIILKEMNLLHKTLLYATDLNPNVLDVLKKGIFPLGHIKLFAENYIASGGEKDFSCYYTAKYDLAKFDQQLRERVVVSTHNLVSDSSFNEFQLILCRNVLIYFESKLQDRVFRLFEQSLDSSGFLALGAKETLRYSNSSGLFKVFNLKERIWRKSR
ncbi:MAG: protein-glutamate O-methyltransferase CheR [Chitinophagaceae bacterium]